MQDETAHLNQFIVHSSLDMLEKAMWTNSMMYVRFVAGIGWATV